MRKIAETTNQCWIACWTHHRVTSLTGQRRRGARTRDTPGKVMLLLPPSQPGRGCGLGERVLAAG